MLAAPTVLEPVSTIGALAISLPDYLPRQITMQQHHYSNP
jgi:hypothetical protein